MKTSMREVFHTRVPSLAQAGLACLVLVLAAAVSTARLGDSHLLARPLQSIVVSPRADTLWIFDADFEDLGGHNLGTDDLGQPGDSLTGWFSFDASPVPPQDAHWHRDSFNAFPDGVSPDYSMWCGKRDDCWETWGYGDNWRQHLIRDIDLTPYGGHEITLWFRQKFAIEVDYDYGYVDVAPIDGGQPGSYATLHTVTNPAFGWPGVGQNWDSPNYGVVELDLSYAAGDSVRLRWRFESDSVVSSATHSDEYPLAVAEGAWYIDEVMVLVDSSVVFFADFEDSLDSANQGWVASAEWGGQVGVTWRRAYDPPIYPTRRDGRWYLVATDSLTQMLVEGQAAVLTSPPLGIPEADTFVVVLEGYQHHVDSFPTSALVSTAPDLECLRNVAQFSRLGSVSADTAGTLTWSAAFAVPSGDSYLALQLRQYRHSGDPAGFYLDRVRVGAVDSPTGVSDAPSGAPPLSLRATYVHGLPGLVCRLGGPPERVFSVRIYDVAGRLVHKDSGVLSATGSAETRWRFTDGIPPASGVYFARATAGNLSATDKVAVVR